MVSCFKKAKLPIFWTKKNDMSFRCLPFFVLFLCNLIKHFVYIKQLFAIDTQHCRCIYDKPDIDRQHRAYFVLFWTTPMTKIGILTISVFAHDQCLHDI